MQQIDILGYLRSKGYQGRNSGGHEYHFPCWYHGEDPGKRGRLYVNCDPDAEILGLHDCKVCGQHGALPSIRRHFGDPPLEKEGGKEDTSETRLEILRVAAAFYHDQLADHPDVLAYLKGPKRMLTIETIVDARLGYAAEEIEQDLAAGTVKTVPTKVLYRHLTDMGYTPKDILETGLVTEAGRGERKFLMDSLAGMITIPYMVAGNVVGIRGRSWPYDEDDKTKPKYKTCGGTSARLYNTDAVWDTKEISFTEGEFDALVLKQLGFPAVGLPGAGTWQESWDSYMTSMRRIWIVLDRDKAGDAGAKKLLDRFGSKARRVHLSPQGLKCDPTQWVSQGHTAEEFAALLQDAQTGGLLVTVDEAIAEHTEVQGAVGIQFGYSLLDNALAPGILPGQLCIPLAKTGTGKTVFLLNLMQRMCMVPSQKDMKLLFVSLEQTRGEWWERARRIYRFNNPGSNDAEAAEFWRERIMIVDKNRVSSNEMRQILDDYEYRMGKLPDVVALDYLGYWAQSFKGDRYERTADAVMTLKGLAKEIRIPFLVPHQVSRGARDGEEFSSDAARDAGVVEETADFVMAIWSPDNSLGRVEAERQGVINMKITKSRHGSRGLVLNWYWAPLSLCMVPRGDKLAKFARDEMAYNGPGYRDTWETAQWRHETGNKNPADHPTKTVWSQQTIVGDRIVTR